MPEIPGPSDDLSPEQQRAWLQGAATVAQLQSDQWAILAKQYREAAESLEDAGDADDEAEDDDHCPDCGADALVDGLGGEVCTECDYGPN
ncbi:hypothetical protein [Haloarcula pellucida]|uniref:Uncharacterized protein n=1 Tax=Haloarcula pellucida TaxID=1427151 RepID=A0A830GT40_9EURY|nr:hypothetical protein [Halomicroarcula pellucida]MBX0350474.1 hypothetical protein [Halomicroarcula pellucida]GGO03497.1 hypothetical protein GCM10009030_39200 [Halomicroarcula pellucida]